MSSSLATRLLARSLSRPHIGAVHHHRHPRVKALCPTFPSSWHRASDSHTGHPRWTSTTLALPALRAPPQPASSAPLVKPGFISRLFTADKEPAPDVHRRLRRRLCGLFLLVNFGVSLVWVAAAAQINEAKTQEELKRGKMFDSPQALSKELLNGNIDTPIFTFLRHHATLSKDNLDAGRWHTVITHNFSHVDPTHFLTNMIGFIMLFRAAFAAGLPPAAVVFVCVGSGAIGGYLSVPLLPAREELGPNTDSPPPARGTLGASGIVTGLAAAVAVAAPRMPFFLGFTPWRWPVWTVAAVPLSGDLLAVVFPQAEEHMRHYNTKAQQLRKLKEANHVAAVEKRAEEIKAEKAGRLERWKQSFQGWTGRWNTGRRTTSTETADDSHSESSDKQREVQVGPPETSRVNHYGHLFGATFGAVVGLVLRRRPF